MFIRMNWDDLKPWFSIWSWEGTLWLPSPCALSQAPPWKGKTLPCWSLSWAKVTHVCWAPVVYSPTCVYTSVTAPASHQPGACILCIVLTCFTFIPCPPVIQCGGLPQLMILLSTPPLSWPQSVIYWTVKEKEVLPCGFLLGPLNVWCKEFREKHVISDFSRGAACLEMCHTVWQAHGTESVTPQWVSPASCWTQKARALPQVVLSVGNWMILNHKARVERAACDWELYWLLLWSSPPVKVPLAAREGHRREGLWPKFLQELEAFVYYWSPNWPRKKNDFQEGVW